jgi:ATP-dependent Lhr-like helicase
VVATKADPTADPLAPFGPAVRAWFEATFEVPTPAQTGGWAAIAQGRHTLIHAPTGSGKTLAAFLWCLDRLVEHPRPAPTREHPGTVRVLYVSPLKALTYDVERNLRAPLAGIALAAARIGQAPPQVSVASRTGDTPADERRDLVRHPPDILVTTPESLYLLLTSQARDILKGVDHVIVDEVHAIAGTKRGAHLALSLERLERLRGATADGGGRPPIQRIGLSATQRPLETIARYLGGTGEGREVTIVDAGARKPLELQVVVPVEDMSRLGEVLPMDEQPGGPVVGGEMRTSIWPAVHPRILELIRSHRSTIVFTNSRRLAERLAQRLNELAGEELVRAHHGSIAREQRLEIEEELKAGRLPALVATSSLELGIDMGAVDLVIQVESPTSVARGLQRIGRAGHQVGEPSKGVIFPKYRGDLLETAVVVKGMHEGSIEQTTLPRNPLDVLAQQLVAMTIGERFSVDELLEIVRRAAPFETLTREVLEGVLGMLAGAYPSDEFAELKPRVVWDRVTDTVEGRRDARVVAVTSGGTIPDRGLFPVFLEGEAGSPGRRVGELDEEMVYELRAGMHGDVVILGASSWRVAEISPNRVTVTPAPGVPGKLPFWKGDTLGRPIELGRAMGAFTREAEADLEHGARGRAKAIERLRRDHDLDELAAENLLHYLEDERAATGTLPTDRRIVVQRFRDELGDWRLVVLTPFGGRVHAPWTMALEARLSDRLGFDVQTIWSDDGIAIRMPEGESSVADVEQLLFPDPEEVEDLVVGRVGQSSLFASRFRENAARALLLPRRRPGTRTPLWQQRQRSADLLAVASRYGSFPILVETYRECLADVFDLPALREILDGVRRREIAVHSVETARASAFASSLLFDYIAQYMYEGDAPLAERRAQALTLDRDLLRELLGQEELRELLDAEALSDLELSLQALIDERHAHDPDQVHDLLRRLGDLSTDEAGARTAGGRPEASLHLAELAASRRAVRARIGGEERWIAMEDVARYRDGVGVSAPPGVPQAFLEPATAALDGLLARYARTHGPFLAAEPARRWGLPAGVVDDALHRLVAAGSLLAGEFRPGGAEREFCDPEVLRLLRRRSLAKLRREVEPVDPVTLARFLPAWQGVAPSPSAGGPAPAPLRGPAALERLAEVVDQLAGLPIPASVLERDVLPARVPGYQPRLLDEVGAMGEVAWVGRGSLGRDDGRVVLYRPGRELLRPTGLPDGTERPDDEIHEKIRAHLRRRGASFYRELFGASGGRSDREVLDALWDLVWAGEVTNDTFAPLRALRWKRPAKDRRPRMGRLTSLGPPEAAGRWSLAAAPEDELPDEAPAATRTERVHALTLALLERHGVVTREAVASEPIDGAFSAVYPVLRAMEEGGRIRRGYFVDGLGAAQFALPGAVDRLRSMRDQPGELASERGRVVHLLAAADPANPYGAALPWPRRGDDDRRPYQRAAGAYVVLVDGAAVLYLDRGGTSFQTLPVADDPETLAAAIASLRDLVADGRVRELVISKVDGEPVASSPVKDALLAAGFVAGYRGYALRSAPAPTERTWPGAAVARSSR